MYKLNATFTSVPSVFLMSTEVPYHMIESLNGYLDKLYGDKERKSKAKDLVGQIKRGQQLKIDHEDDAIKEFSKLCYNLSLGYVDSFSRTLNLGTKFKKLTPQMDELWSVHSFEGDYNPIHAHGTKTTVGISFTTWTRIPKQMRETKAGANLFNSSGGCDGFITFYCGPSGSDRDTAVLRPPGTMTIKPEVGKIYFFPSWLQHSVYPFFGEGERRSVAGNLSMWQTPEIKNE
jgi:hypothetical protein